MSFSMKRIMYFRKTFINYRKCMSKEGRKKQTATLVAFMH